MLDSLLVPTAIVALAEIGDNIVTVPQLYGGTYTLFAHMLPRQGIEVRFAEDDSVAAIEALIDHNTKAIFMETIGNPAGNIVDIEAVAAMAGRHGVATIADNTVASPSLLRHRHCSALVDQIYGRPRHHTWRHYCRFWQLPVERARRALSSL